MTASRRPGIIAHDKLSSIVARTLSAVRFGSKTRRATDSISRDAPGYVASTWRAASWPSSWFHRNTSVML